MLTTGRRRKDAADGGRRDGDGVLRVRTTATIWRCPAQEEGRPRAGGTWGSIGGIREKGGSAGMAGRKGKRKKGLTGDWKTSFGHARCPHLHHFPLFSSKIGAGLKKCMCIAEDITCLTFSICSVGDLV